ncbi:MAG: hypothetical protein O2944_05610 [Proteobacteria bacterium]|nr:hypothetical protein [Pseudomonadota bacterium]
MRRNHIIAAVVAVAGTLATGFAQAAPQVLAVMASLGPQTLHCEGSICVTTFSSYCLQQERTPPVTGQRYLPAADQQFSLILTDAAGKKTRMAATEHVEFRAGRGFTTVGATMSIDVMQRTGAVSAMLDVAANAALVPEPVLGDPNPISASELAFATRSLREHGNEVVDAKPDAVAASLVNRLAVTIQPMQPATEDNLKQLWHDVIDGLGPAVPVNADGIGRARKMYDWCQGHSSYHSMAGIKSCLEFRHDDQILRLNTDYWNSQPGF